MNETEPSAVKMEYPHWGAPKIREKLKRLYPNIHCPAISTVHAVLDRHGLAERRKCKRHKTCGDRINHERTPNAL